MDSIKVSKVAFAPEASKGQREQGRRKSRGGSRAFFVKKARRALDSEFVRLLICHMSTVV